MFYKSEKDWRDSKQKRILLFGMSGLGKTHISNLLRETGGWFHYSVDYRIGTHYLGEYIADSFKREAMKVPLLRELLMTDSVHIASNITFDNLAPLSAYLGKPGAMDKEGLPFEDYIKRQDEHREAEIAALLDTARFIERARSIYDYQNFVCDSSGSICEVVRPDDPNDPILTALTKHLLLVWIEGTDDHTADLISRFDKAPKPMYYQPEFLRNSWQEYLSVNNTEGADVDPDDFVRWTYAKALAERQPRYEAMAKNWGVRIKAEDLKHITSANEFCDLVADALKAA